MTKNNSTIDDHTHGIRHEARMAAVTLEVVADWLEHTGGGNQARSCRKQAKKLREELDLPPMTRTEIEERIEDWGEERCHHIRVSERMLAELQEHGKTTSAGTSLFGPELLVLELVRHDD